MQKPDGNRDYMNRWFWTLDQLTESVGTSPDVILEHVRAGCAPGPVYVHAEDGTWWSALDRATPAPVGHCWYSPGASWPLRRTVLAARAGSSAAQAARAEQDKFVGEFVAVLGLVDGAELAFPQCFVGGRTDRAAAEEQAAKEWQSWIGGGYGVCLRIFNAQTCIQKESLRAAMISGLEEGVNIADDLLRQAEALAGLILPFAPWQRATGTPGRTIDRLLSNMSLGRELPYA